MIVLRDFQSVFPNFALSKYTLRTALVSGQALETLGAFRCDVSAERAMEDMAKRHQGRGGEPFKIQVLEDGVVINERLVE